MGLLKATNYDPATVVSKPVNVALAMTALDTTNLRLTFTAPDSGNVLVRLAGNMMGQYATGGLLFGVLEGSTVRARVLPSGAGNWYTSNGNGYVKMEATFTITGLTPQTSYTWDAAYGVEAPSSNTFAYGGPNDAVSNSAYGAFTFEVWVA